MMGEELGVRSEELSTPVNPQSLGLYITEIMRPVMETVSKLLENNTAALEQLSAAQSIQNDRLEALEKQIRLQTPVSGKQVGYLNDAIRERARSLLEKYGYENDKKTVTRVGNAIRRAVLARYGISCLREIPRHEYTVAMSQVSMWSNALTVRDIVKEAQKREEQTEEADH